MFATVFRRIIRTRIRIERQTEQVTNDWHTFVRNSIPCSISHHRRCRCYIFTFAIEDSLILSITRRNCRYLFSNFEFFTNESWNKRVGKFERKCVSRWNAALRYFSVSLSSLSREMVRSYEDDPGINKWLMFDNWLQPILVTVVSRSRLNTCMFYLYLPTPLVERTTVDRIRRDAFEFHFSPLPRVFHDPSQFILLSSKPLHRTILYIRGPFVALFENTLFAHLGQIFTRSIGQRAIQRKKASRLIRGKHATRS